MFEIATLTILNEQIENKAHCKKRLPSFPPFFTKRLSVCNTGDRVRDNIVLSISDGWQRIVVEVTISTDN